ncbi:hypothetical protein SNEBB_005107 [Seison nebaliae]|nr:hypothetical protein SNEBB_005107 [Seison nebaliae]
MSVEEHASAIARILTALYAYDDIIVLTHLYNTDETNVRKFIRLEKNAFAIYRQFQVEGKYGKDLDKEFLRSHKMEHDYIFNKILATKAHFGSGTLGYNMEQDVKLMEVKMNLITYWLKEGYPRSKDSLNQAVFDTFPLPDEIKYRNDVACLYDIWRHWFSMKLIGEAAESFTQYLNNIVPLGRERLLPSRLIMEKDRLDNQEQLISDLKSRSTSFTEVTTKVLGELDELIDHLINTVAGRRIQFIRHQQFHRSWITELLKQAKQHNNNVYTKPMVDEITEMKQMITLENKFVEQIRVYSSNRMYVNFLNEDDYSLITPDRVIKFQSIQDSFDTTIKVVRKELLEIKQKNKMIRSKIELALQYNERVAIADKKKLKEIAARLARINAALVIQRAYRAHLDRKYPYRRKKGRKGKKKRKRRF